jgi:ankyrin repeat protein
MKRLLIFFVMFLITKSMENNVTVCYRSDLHDAVEYDDLDKAENCIVVKGINPNWLYVCNLPLSSAARRGNVPMCRLLLRNGADINGQDSTESTAVYTAAFFSQFEVVRYLCCRGADANHVKKGSTPLHAAILSGATDRKGLFKTVSTLLLCGARRDLRDSASRTPAESAAFSGFEDITMLLQARDPLGDGRVQKMEKLLEGMDRRHWIDDTLESMVSNSMDIPVGR